MSELKELVQGMVDNQVPQDEIIRFVKKYKADKKKKLDEESGKTNDDAEVAEAVKILKELKASE